MIYSIDLNDLLNEEWKDIVGYENYYQVSNMGRIKSLERKTTFKTEKLRIMKGFIDKWGYHQVILRKDDKYIHFKIHRLVALHFIPNPNNKETVNHKKGNKLDNRSSELEWNTHSEQHKHAFEKLGRVHGMKGKISSQIKGVQQLDKEGNILFTFTSIHEAAKEVNGNYQNISAVCNGRLKTHKNFKWKFIENDEN